MSNLIPISEVEQGMILAAPILNRYGQVLLSTGIELLPKHMKIFKTWGIKVVSVRENNDEEQEATDEMKEQAEKHFANRITWQPTSAIESNLYEIGLKKAIMDMLKKK